VRRGTVVRCFETRSIRIPVTVREIGDSAFCGVVSLEELNFDEGVERIGIMAFSNCSRIGKVSFPALLAMIDRLAFWYCDGLREVLFAARSQLQFIGSEAFSSFSLREVVLSIAEIDPSAFNEKVWPIVKFSESDHFVSTGDFLCSSDAKTIWKCISLSHAIVIPAHIEVTRKI
jgi:hypothetical protein